MPQGGELRRELGLPSATMLGLGSILGTGVFVSIGLVAGLAGSWIVVAVAVAALVATCNALSSAQLAAAFPQSGGTYEYGYRLLHPLAGFTAGWMFLCAKSASAATAALGFAGYVLEAVNVSRPGARVWLASGAVVVLTALVASGLRRSNVANIIIVSVTVLALGAFVAAGLPRAAANWRSHATAMPDWSSLLEATALMFVAYTGYGRVATLGEEVAKPRVTIPKAIVATLVVSAFLYVAVAAVGVGAVGGEAMSRATEGRSATLEVVSRSFGLRGLPEIVALGAVTAMLGVLLNLLLGLSRVLLAMGRRGDMPRSVTMIDARRSTPHVAVVVVGAMILLLTLRGSVKTAWSFSAFTVLIYYSLTNLAALRLPAARRLYPRAWAVGGLFSCLFLAFWVERSIWLAGLALIAAGIVWHVVAQRVSRTRTMAIILGLGLLAGGRADATTERSSAPTGPERVGYPDYRWRLEIPLVAVGAGAFLASRFVDVDLEPVPFEGLDPATIGWSFDRDVVGNRDESANTASHWMRGASVAFPLVITLASSAPGERLRAVGRRSGVYAEAFLIREGVTTLWKRAAARARPFAYLPEDERPGGRSYDVTRERAFKAMPSGHTSTAWTAVGLGVTEHLLTRRDASSRERIAIGFLGGVLAGATSGYRVKSGQHFPTDVLAGSALGVAIGVTVPLLHRGGARLPARRSWLEAVAGTIVGATVGHALASAI